MLFQPSDLPRPDPPAGRLRLRQGDPRRSPRTGAPRREPHYDLSIIEDDEELERLGRRPGRRGGRPAPAGCRRGDPGVRSRLGVAPPAAPQDRLCRAARIIDQLEARGYIGAFDGSNARQVLRRDASGAGRARDVGDEDEDDDRRRASTLDPCGASGPPAAMASRGQEPRTTAAGWSACPTGCSRRARPRAWTSCAPSARRRSAAQYLAAMERGAWAELPAGVYARGFLRNYAIYLGLDPDEVLAAWGRERGEVPVEPLDRGAASDRGASTRRSSWAPGSSSRASSRSPPLRSSPTSASSFSGSRSRRRSRWRIRQRRSRRWPRTRPRTRSAGRPSAMGR